MKQRFVIFAKIFFSLLDLIFFKQKKYIVFSTRVGKDYADNSKFIYEYFLSKNNDNVFFFTKKKEVLKKIPKNGIYAYSWKGLSILLRAKILVFTHGSGDFFPYFPDKSANRIFINLFHAIAVKKVGNGINNTKEIKHEIAKWSFFIVSSDFEKSFIKEQYLLKESQIITLGQSRNDILIKNKNKNAKRKRVLYAPTFRDSTMTKLFPFEDQDLDSLDVFLQRKNIDIIIRLHINEENNYKDLKKYKKLKNIRFEGTDISPSINDVLHTFSFVISDYSSIIIDYLLLNRPVAYIPYDYKEYEKERVFSFDFFKNQAGPSIYSQKELIAFLDSKEDKFFNRRIELANKFHQFQDGKSTKRLYNFIKKYES
jgi:CDP-glycerol glycerophosphotransferase (TagB/SpsB family)